MDVAGSTSHNASDRGKVKGRRIKTILREKTNSIAVGLRACFGFRPCCRGRCVFLLSRQIKGW